jgi:hypothetical protein
MKQEQPKNIEEAVAIVLAAMSAEQITHLEQIREEGLINEHFGFALWVRNLLGHWVPPTADGEYPAHSDDISGKITEIIWTKLQDKPQP